MSCDLKIQNVGSDIVALSVVDFNGKPIVPEIPSGKKYEPDGVTINILPSMKDISMKVDGGVYIMKVANISSNKNNDTDMGWWSGLIPCGSSIIKIDGDRKVVTYGDRELVNTHKNNNKLSIFDCVEDNPTYFTTTNIFIIIAISAVIIIGFYMYKRKK